MEILLEKQKQQPLQQFKIDLIVWKSTQVHESEWVTDVFKIDLIVWKLIYKYIDSLTTYRLK